MDVDGAALRRPSRAPPAARRARRYAYDAEIFVAYTRHIIEQMGGAGPRVDACAREIYAEWAACHHFDLYDEVPAVLRELPAAACASG